MNDILKDPDFAHMSDSGAGFNTVVIDFLFYLLFDFGSQVPNLLQISTDLQ